MVVVGEGPGHGQVLLPVCLEMIETTTGKVSTS
jgi:hypothetical protein